MKSRVHSWVAVWLIALAAAAQVAPAQRIPGRRSQAEDKTTGFRENPRMLAAFKSVVTTPSKSVVRVLCDDKPVALGTIVSADGYVLTKHSQLAAGVTPTVTLPGGKGVEAKVVGVSERYDLAMLKVEAKGLVPVQWGEARSAAVGDLLACPGPEGEALAAGVLSVATRTVRLRDLPASTPPANSGFLGVSLEEADGGARIMSIVPGSAAAKAGLKVDDVVTLIADTPIIDSETMVNTIQHHKPGDTVVIKLRRGEQELEVKATLDKRTPDPRFDRRDFQNHMGSELSDRRGGFPQILQHDMAIKPSDCGGPVVDLDGRAVGINIARAGRVESYALPAEAVRGLLDDLKSGKLAPAGKGEPSTRPAAATTQQKQ
jgi:serine protease Do